MIFQTLFFLHQLWIMIAYHVCFLFCPRTGGDIHGNKNTFSNPFFKVFRTCLFLPNFDVKWSTPPLPLPVCLGVSGQREKKSPMYKHIYWKQTPVQTHTHVKLPSYENRKEWSFLKVQRCIPLPIKTLRIPITWYMKFFEIVFWFWFKGYSKVYHNWW